MFKATSVPRMQSQRTLRMQETDSNGVVTQRTRPAAQILLKTAPQPSYQAVRVLDGEQFAVAWGGPYIVPKTPSKFGRLTSWWPHSRDWPRRFSSRGGLSWRMGGSAAV